MAPAIREHLLLGSERFGTLITGCGRTPEKIRNEYVLGASSVVPEVEYVRLRGISTMRACGGCERAWKKICRDRGQKWTPTARSIEAALTDDQLQRERVAAWRSYEIACLASGFAPLPGSCVPIDAQAQRNARRELADELNARAKAGAR